MRPSPVNTEAEEAFLACCLIDSPDGFDSVGKSADMGAAPEWFHKPANGAIWSAVATCYQSGGITDEFAVCGELQRRGQLDIAGGMAELNRIANRVESASGWHRFAVEVKAKFLARRAISEAHRLAERIAAGDELAAALTRAEETLGDIAGQLSDRQERRNPAKERKLAALLAEADAFAFDITRPPVRRPPIMTLNSHPVFKRGDLMLIMAPNKSGKSSVQSASIASTFSSGGTDCLGFDAPNPNGEGILHIMSEESIEDHWDMVNRAIRRAGKTNKPDWLQSYHVRKWSTEKRRDFLFYKAREMAKQFPLRQICIDGFADFVEDTNDIKECKYFIDSMFSLIDELDTSIMGSLHVNPSLKPTERDKGMGHLGSILERKASSIILLKKEPKEGVGDIITINTKDARKGKTDTPPRFIWSEDQQMHVRYVGPTDIVASVKGPGRVKQWTWAKLATFIDDTMPKVSEWQQSHLVAIAQRAGCSPDTVRRAAAKHLAEQEGFSTL